MPKVNSSSKVSTPHLRVREAKSIVWQPSCLLACLPACRGRRCDWLVGFDRSSSRGDRILESKHRSWSHRQNTIQKRPKTGCPEVSKEDRRRAGRTTRRAETKTSQEM
ncbi:hypothetical protein FA10DRAFT_5918 [Acaromyces ingoldii]|uniref:Uncharacterized protein n=1 Tax=Acaromyces ingoldii TaxID=215250 RepID=A0A316YU79_9BASI|nr:hypothetical protein FA10DRAFT_5918 [Acaromyces ingoldii]PWN92791.1 hypothetical protein FA10DRAFT_5918 [Acaromyces ingoldii]